MTNVTETRVLVLVRILKIKKKVELCVRHVPQVLLRGEHVVMVAPENSPSDLTVKSGASDWNENN